MFNTYRHTQRTKFGVFLLAGTLGLLSGCNNDQAHNAAPLPEVRTGSTPVAPNNISTTSKLPVQRPFKPEMLVRFPDSSPICASKEYLAEYMLYGLKGEYTKMHALFVAQDDNGPSCFMISPKAIVRIIGVEYNDPDVDEGLLEVTLPDSVTSHGGWTFTMAAKEVVNSKMQKKH